MITKKDKFIEATKKYIAEIEPLLDINKKLNVANMRFHQYQIMIDQGWYSGNVELKNGIISHPVKKRKFNKTKQYK